MNIWANVVFQCAIILIEVRNSLITTFPNLETLHLKKYYMISWTIAEKFYKIVFICMKMTLIFYMHECTLVNNFKFPQTIERLHFLIICCILFSRFMKIQ